MRTAHLLVLVAFALTFLTPAPAVAFDGGREPRTDERWADAICAIGTPANLALRPMVAWGNGVLVAENIVITMIHVIDDNSNPCDNLGTIPTFAARFTTHPGGSCSTSAVPCQANCNPPSALAVQGPFHDVEIAEYIRFTEGPCRDIVICILEQNVPASIATPLPVSFSLPPIGSHVALGSWGPNGGSWTDCNNQLHNSDCGDCANGSSNPCCKGRLLIKDNFAFSVDVGLNGVEVSIIGVGSHQHDSGAPVLAKDACGNYAVIGLYGSNGTVGTNLISLLPGNFRSMLPTRTESCSSNFFTYSNDVTANGEAFAVGYVQTIGSGWFDTDSDALSNVQTGTGDRFDYAGSTRVFAGLNHTFVGSDHVCACGAGASAGALSASEKTLACLSSGDVDRLQVTAAARCHLDAFTDNFGCLSEWPPPTSNIVATAFMNYGASAELASVQAPFTLDNTSDELHLNIALQLKLSSIVGEVSAEWSAVWRVVYDTNEDGDIDAGEPEMTTGLLEVSRSSTGTLSDSSSPEPFDLDEWSAGSYVLEVRVLNEFAATGASTTCPHTIATSGLITALAIVDLQLQSE